MAASLVFLIYSHSIDQAGGKTAATRAIFATYPNDAVGPTSVTLAFDEMLGTALLVNFLCKLGEKPGLVVREEDSRPRGRGFESRRILDGCKRC